MIVTPQLRWYQTSAVPRIRIEYPQAARVAEIRSRLNALLKDGGHGFKMILAMLPLSKRHEMGKSSHYSGWCRKHRQYPGVAIEVMPSDLATGEKADQRHLDQGIAHHLQLGMPRAEVRATAS